MKAEQGEIWATEGWAAVRCRQKVPYRSYGSARLAGYKRSIEVGTELYVYKCPNCGTYHLTRTPQAETKQEFR